MCRTITSAMKVIDSMFASRNMDTASNLRKAKLLLGSYRHICWASQGTCRMGSADDYLISDEEIDQALDALDVSPEIVGLIEKYDINTRMGTFINNFRIIAMSDLFRFL